MKIFKKLKKDFSYGSFKTIKWGTYSANKTLLFIILCIICVCIMFGKTLNNGSVQIKNEYIRKIYLACVAPFADFSEKYKIDLIIPEARATFLRLTKLENHTEWDSYYYADDESLYNENTNISKDTKEKPEIRSINELTQNAIKKSKENKDNIKELTENIKDLEETLSFLNKTITELKNIKDKQALSESFEARMKKQKEEEEKKAKEKEKEELAKQEKTKKKKLVKKFGYTKTRPLKVLMVGDSQMTSISRGLMRLVGQNSSIKITAFSVHSSGFIRGDYYNWQKKLKNIFSQGKYDIAVILMGMNDYQNFYNDNGKVMVKETKRWEDEYHKRIKNHLDILLRHTKKVYWLGMPIVRNRAYNENLEYIEKVQKKLSEKYEKANLTRFAIANVAPGKGVPYSDVIKTADGSIIKLMNDDGNHYTISGGAYIMQSFMNLLYQEWSIEPIKK